MFINPFIINLYWLKRVITVKHPDLIKKCLEIWDSDVQTFLFVEECGKLLQEISKIRWKDAVDVHVNLQEEVADMLIMF